jgi:hypothetical protein
VAPEDLDVHMLLARIALAIDIVLETGAAVLDARSNTSRVACHSRFAAAGESQPAGVSGRTRAWYRASST